MSWIVDIKGESGARSFEINVVWSDNAHGLSSYGWYAKDKLLITHNGGPCNWPLTQRVWDKCVKVAHEVADELNREGVTPSDITEMDSYTPQAFWPGEDSIA